MRRSIESALVGCAMILKKEIVLEKSPFSVCSSTYWERVGSWNTADSVRRLPHCL